MIILAHLSEKIKSFFKKTQKNFSDFLFLYILLEMHLEIVYNIKCVIIFILCLIMTDDTWFYTVSGTSGQISERISNGLQVFIDDLCTYCDFSARNTSS